MQETYFLGKVRRDRKGHLWLLTPVACIRQAPCVLLVTVVQNCVEAQVLAVPGSTLSGFRSVHITLSASVSSTVKWAKYYVHKSVVVRIQ